MRSLVDILKAQNRKYYSPLLKNLFAHKGDKRYSQKGIVYHFAYFILNFKICFRGRIRLFSGSKRKIHDLERNFLDPEWSFLDPVRNFLDPEWSLLDPVRSILDPEKSFLDPVRSILDPERSFLDPVRSILDPEKSLPDPERSILDPERSLQGRVWSFLLPIHRQIATVNYDFNPLVLYWNFTKAGPEMLNTMILS